MAKFVIRKRLDEVVWCIGANQKSPSYVGVTGGSKLGEKAAS